MGPGSKIVFPTPTFNFLELSLSRRIRDTIFIHCKHPELDHDAMLERGDLPASLVSTSHLHHRLPSPTVRTLPHFFLDFLLGNRHSLKQGSHSRSFQNIPTLDINKNLISVNNHRVTNQKDILVVTIKGSTEGHIEVLYRDAMTQDFPT